MRNQNSDGNKNVKPISLGSEKTAKSSGKVSGLEELHRQKKKTENEGGKLNAASKDSELDDIYGMPKQSKFSRFGPSRLPMEVKKNDIGAVKYTYSDRPAGTNKIKK